MDHCFCPGCQGNLIRKDELRKHRRNPRPPIEEPRKCYCSTCSELQPYRIVYRLTRKLYRRRDIRAGVNIHLLLQVDSDLFDDNQAIGTSIDDSEEESLSDLESIQTANYSTSEDYLVRRL